MIILRDQMICKSEKCILDKGKLKFHKAVFIFPGKSLNIFLLLCQRASYHLYAFYWLFQLCRHLYSVLSFLRILKALLKESRKVFICPIIISSRTPCSNFPSQPCSQIINLLICKFQHAF